MFIRILLIVYFNEIFELCHVNPAGVHVQVYRETYCDRDYGIPGRRVRGVRNRDVFSIALPRMRYIVVGVRVFGDGMSAPRNVSAGIRIDASEA